MQQDRVVVITGAAGGMGSVLVDRFLANGDTIVAADTKGESLETLRGKRDAGAKLVIVEADISEEGGLRQARRRRPRHGRADRRARQLRGLLPDPPLRGDVG